ncbi:MAG: hypothetical protein JWM00_298 [Candidatus Saccharibacteria bacterium]|nr:hypothetical protein [Candidatus Saccharibacteria bacterium]
MAELHRDIPREPSLLDTAMRIENPEHLERLKLKLEEYKERTKKRAKRVEDTHPDLQLLQVGPDIFKEPILDYVVTAAAVRDTTTDPIVITEVALAVGEATGYDVSRSVTVPFRYNDDGMVFEPDFKQLRQEATLADLGFSSAYAVIKAYANNDLWGIEGGTGLPSIPVGE